MFQPKPNPEPNPESNPKPDHKPNSQPYPFSKRNPIPKAYLN